jgi:hypothetical protein
MTTQPKPAPKRQARALEPLADSAQPGALPVLIDPDGSEVPASDSRFWDGLLVHHPGRWEFATDEHGQVVVVPSVKRVVIMPGVNGTTYGPEGKTDATRLLGQLAATPGVRYWTEEQARQRYEVRQGRAFILPWVRLEVDGDAVIPRVPPGAYVAWVREQQQNGKLPRVPSQVWLRQQLLQAQTALSRAGSHERVTAPHFQARLAEARQRVEIIEALIAEYAGVADAVA